MEAAREILDASVGEAGVEKWGREEREMSIASRTAVEFEGARVCAKRFLKEWNVLDEICLGEAPDGSGWRSCGFGSLWRGQGLVAN